MSFGTALVIIVAIGAVTSVIRGRQRARAGIIADKQGNESYIPKADPDAQREVKELRERIKVLERIATDANTSESRKIAAISDEIESLRDK
ncbi:hypothetical protein QWY75_00615 [Pontixanthobacter aestiaquae]|uniref:Phage shock protein B n=1 Tax=Pontixanthobacter aestiaquae TaxID=1509367 RepID=A0A844ZAG4_9SPHN|nr:hypothetical protein [Pontixanthobacter aestiaquae]MDN3644700.1 hypothetical protein [Pontixanthobacter aestiaquae]MXO84292.1 hypothetical protein [Pontixanthobacter aestiaquae]